MGSLVAEEADCRPAVPSADQAGPKSARWWRLLLLLLLLLLPLMPPLPLEPSQAVTLLLEMLDTFADSSPPSASVRGQILEMHGIDVGG